MLPKIRWRVHRPCGACRFQRNLQGSPPDNPVWHGDCSLSVSYGPDRLRDAVQLVESSWGDATPREIPVRELFLVISVMGAGFLSVQTTHRIVGTFLEKPGMPDVTLDMPIDLASDTRGLSRAEIVAHGRKCSFSGMPEPYLPVEKEWLANLSSDQEQPAIARFACNAASVSSNGNGAHEPPTLR